MVGWFIRGGKKVAETIKSVKPNIPTTKLEKAKSKLNIAIQKTKASKAKLKQTIFDIQQKKKKKSWKDHVDIDLLMVILENLVQKNQK